jgi:hypothetical protein
MKFECIKEGSLCPIGKSIQNSNDKLNIGHVDNMSHEDTMK